MKQQLGAQRASLELVVLVFEVVLFVFVFWFAPAVDSGGAMIQRRKKMGLNMVLKMVLHRYVPR